MPSNWIVLSSEDLIQVISSQLREKSDENIGDDVKPGQAFDPDLPSRADAIISLVVAQFRGAIQKAGKYPLSVTEDSIPPDLQKHVLNMAAFELVNSTQNLQMVIMTEKGAYSPFQSFYKAANDELEKLRKGYAIVLPTDPTGADYINPINVKWGTGTNGFPAYNSANPINLPIEGTKVGGNSNYTDLTTDQSIFGEREECFPVGNLGQP